MDLADIMDSGHHRDTYRVHHVHPVHEVHNVHLATPPLRVLTGDHNHCAGDRHLHLFRGSLGWNQIQISAVATFSVLTEVQSLDLFFFSDAHTDQPIDDL